MALDTPSISARPIHAMGRPISIFRPLIVARRKDDFVAPTVPWHRLFCYSWWLARASTCAQGICFTTCQMVDTCISHPTSIFPVKFPCLIRSILPQVRPEKRQSWASEKIKVY